MGYYGLRILVLGGEDNSFFNFVIHPVALVHFLFHFCNKYWGEVLLKALLCWKNSVHLAVAGGVFDGVFCAVLFPTRCLG